MSVQYTYEVVSVDDAARCMEVVYTSEGNPTMHIGTRLPFEGETLEAVVEMYAPVRYWEELKTPVIPVTPGSGGSVVVPDPPAPDPAAMAIAQRDSLLQQSDYTQLPDVPMTDELREQWRVYRQALRDITSQPGFPDNINWPVQPGIPVTVA